MAHRFFQDSNGLEWTVWETRPSGAEVSDRRKSPFALPTEFADGWLTFEAAGNKRRLAPIPPDWLSASEDTLQSLCNGASPAPKR